MARGQMTRFHAKLIDSMVFDIFCSVYNKCGHDMKDTQRSLSFLFFGEEHLDEMDNVSHPDVLRDLLVRRMINPNKFIEVFNHVHTL